MKQLTINQDMLKTVIKDTIKETLREERVSLFLSMIPAVSDKEMKEIEEICGKPSDYAENEFVDITDWFNK
jgi:hypothetical protein